MVCKDWEKTVVAFLNLLTMYWFVQTEENHGLPTIRIASNATEIPRECSQV